MNESTHPDGQELYATVIELQTQLAFQEDTIQILNDRVIDQQKQIDNLLLLYKETMLKLERQSMQNDSVNEKPPHY